MEDLRRLNNRGIGRKDIADMVECSELRKRFCIEEEQVNCRLLLFGGEVLDRSDEEQED